MQLADHDDKQLVDAMANGDSHALAALYDRYSSTLLAVAHRMLGSKHNAEDLVHDVFLEAWRHAGDYSSSRGGVRTWLLLRLRSRAIDRLRSASRRRVSVVEDGDLAEIPDPQAEAFAFTPDRAVLVEAIESLPPLQRRALECAYFRGMSASEIAEEEAIPIGTVKSRLAAALRKLRGEMRDAMWSPEES